MNKITDPVMRKVAESNIRVWQKVERTAFLNGNYDVAIEAQKRIAELRFALSE